MTSNLISGLYTLLLSIVFHAQNVFAAVCEDDIGTPVDCTTGEPIVTPAIQLMEPIGDCKKLYVEPGLGTFFQYFNLLWPYLIGSAAGIAVLMAVVGGLQIIMSGGDQGKRQEGIDRFKNAILGLLMALFAGLILRTLNPSFFVSGNIDAVRCSTF